MERDQNVPYSSAIWRYISDRTKNKSKNIYKLHIKVEELDSSQTILRAKQLVGLGNGSFGWREVSVDYAPVYVGCHYLRLVIWHGHETSQPLPNILSIDYIKIYNMAKYNRPVSLDVPFIVSRSGRYDLFVRCLESEKGGNTAIFRQQGNPSVHKGATESIRLEGSRGVEPDGR